MRAGLEIFAARLAATRLDDGALTRMADAVTRMRANVDHLDAFVEADLAFHYELAAATGNATLVELLQIVRSLLRVWVDRAVAEEEHATTATDEHERVLDAIRTGDPDRAASAMSAHMGTASARLAGLATAAE
ncbi:FadR/GntR family transcriptional regulator [Agrococcus jejuensis]|uniref:FadR/GntR family transcriptional regulator n=1 Tax=Agrococcus jejuensis TaxID=399736 RepID=UPI0012F923E9|nr:FCD domain-containing protein [Agrococcus jejuensis]